MLPSGSRRRRPRSGCGVPRGGMSPLEDGRALAWFGEPDAARHRLLALHAAGVERILRLKGTWDAECGAASTPGSDS